MQAFSFERAYGLQFHVEQTNETVPQWSCIPEYKTALEETLGSNALDKFTSGDFSSIISTTAVHNNPGGHPTIVP